jgi:NADH dehydrogenase
LPITFVQAEVAALDLEDGDVELADGRTVPADYLILALGAETNYFNIRGLHEYTLPFQSFADAIRVRDTVWALAASKRGCVRIVVCGGGPTGVELASELRFLCGQLLETAPECGGCRLDVKVIDANATVVSASPREVTLRVSRRLAMIGVETMPNERVTSVTKERVQLESGRSLPYDLCIWTGGTMASHVVRDLPLRRTVRGQLTVDGTLECHPLSPSIELGVTVYGIGDNIHVADPVTKRPAAGMARAALEQATVVAHNVIEDAKVENGLSAEARKRTYRPRDYPHIIPVGGKYAVAKIGSFVVSGFWGWLAKGLVELFYLASIMPFLHALKVWLKGLKIFIQNDRLG